MKQDLNSEQTARLIELGFEKPKNKRWVLDVANESTPSIQNIVKKQDYSIGELIEMLPPHIGRWELDIFYNLQFECWVVSIDPENHTTAATELTDALYDMIVKLKEEGVI